MKKLLKNEMILYLIFGVLTTIVYFVSRFLVVGLTGNSLIAVIVAQVSAIVFAFFTNKYFVFLDKESKPLVVLKQFFVFLSGRLFVFFLDISITFLAVQRYSNTLIRFFNLEKLPYDQFLFSNTLTRNFIGTPKLLNEFFWALVVQVLAIVINYIISKRKVFKKKDWA